MPHGPWQASRMGVVVLGDVGPGAWYDNASTRCPSLHQTRYQFGRSMTRMDLSISSREGACLAVYEQDKS